MTLSEAPAGTAPRRTWREEQRLDRQFQAQLDLQKEAARSAGKIREKDAAQQRRDDRARTRDERRAKARLARGTWAREHVVDLLFVPVIGVPAVLAWTAMAAYGASMYGPWGRALPALSEGGTWSFAAATTITRHKDDKRRQDDPDASPSPVWHLQLGTVVFAGYGAALNFLHGLHASGPVTGAVMALISVAGVTAHQLVTAGPRRTRSDRQAARIAREITRRRHAARLAAIKDAPIEISPDGTARLLLNAPQDTEADTTTDTMPAARPDGTTDTRPDTSAQDRRTPARTPRADAKTSGRTAGADTKARVTRLREDHPDWTAAQIGSKAGVTDRTVRRHLAQDGPEPASSPQTGETSDAR